MHVVQSVSPICTFRQHPTSSQNNSPYSNYMDVIEDGDDTEDEQTMYVSHAINSTAEASAEV